MQNAGGLARESGVTQGASATSTARYSHIKMRVALRFFLSNHE